MPIYQKRPGVWRIVANVHGKAIERVRACSFEEARAAEARLLLEERAKSPKQDSLVSPALSEFSKGVYRAYAELNLSPGWLSKQFYQLVWILNSLGEIRLDQLRTEDVQRYATERLNAGLRRSSVNNELRTLGRVLSYAREKGYQVPAEVKQIRDTEQRRAKAWTREGVEALWVKSTAEIRPLVKFLANTGCRKGEALAALWDWVNLEGRLLTVHPSEHWKPKSGKPREIPISDSLLRMLERLPRTSPWIFPCPSTGKPYRYWPQKQFDAARKAAGLTGGPHTLRHTFASLFLQKTPDMQLLAQILGHSSTRVTELYAHFLPGHMERGRNAVDI